MERFFCYLATVACFCFVSNHCVCCVYVCTSSYIRLKFMHMLFACTIVHIPNACSFTAFGFFLRFLFWFSIFLAVQCVYLYSTHGCCYRKIKLFLPSSSSSSFSSFFLSCFSFPHLAVSFAGSLIPVRFHTIQRFGATEFTQRRERKK